MGPEEQEREALGKQEEGPKKINQRLEASSAESWVIMQMSAGMTKNQVGMAIMRPLP